MADVNETSPPFHFTDEHHALRASVRRLAAAAYDESTRARYADGVGDDDRVAWRRLSVELGVVGIGVPEELGGTGGTLVDAAIAVEELGAVLATGPFFGTLYTAVPLLTAAPVSFARDELLSQLCAGELTAAVAIPGTGIVAEDGVRAAETEGRRRITGAVEAVVDAGEADILLVAATVDGAPAVLAVDATADGVSRHPLTTFDLTRRQAAVELLDADASLVALGPDAVACIEAAQTVGRVLLAAEQVGAAQRLLDVTVEHAKNRRQFGRPIGSFQAVKHRLADMLVAVEHARSAAYHAAWAVAVDDDPVLAAAIAQAVCSPALSRVAADAIQLHGGIGFTWEHLAHHYFKRAATDAALLGSADTHRDRVASLVLDSADPSPAPPVAHGRPS